MTVLLIGIALMATILGLFWLKDHLQSMRLARMAYHELTARLAIVAFALIVVGALMVAGDLID